MSKLRRTIETARAEYRLQRYDGILADHVLPTRSHVSWRIVAGSLAAAAIAMTAWILLPIEHEHSVVQIDLPAPSAEVAQTTEATADDTETETVALAVEPIPSMPEFGPLWEAGETKTESDENWVPSFPAMNELTQVTTQTVEEPS